MGDYAFSNGGSTIGIANAALTGALAFTAAALFCSFVVLIVRQFLSTNQDMIQYGGMYKKVCGAIAIMFIICAMARCGVNISNTFSTVPSPINHPNANGSDALSIYLTNGSSTQSFSSLSGGGWRDYQAEARERAQEAADEAHEEVIEYLPYLTEEDKQDAEDSPEEIVFDIAKNAYINKETDEVVAVNPYGN